MKLVGDSQTAEWLASAPAFQWDDGNTSKLAKHKNTVEDVNTILQLPVVFAGRIVEPEHDESRWLLLGKLASGKLVAMVFARRGDMLRPISVRAMRPNERRIYGQATGN